MSCGKDAWEKIPQKTIQTLAARSKKRVALDKDFQEIVTEVKKAKAEEDKGLVLGESFDDRKDKQEEYDKMKTLSKAEQMKEYHKRADIREAVNVLVDLIDVQSKVPLKLAQETKKKAPASAQSSPEI